MLDWLLILIVVLLIVVMARGPKVLPEIGTGLGQMIRGFRDAMKEPDRGGPGSQDQGSGPSLPGQEGPGRGGSDGTTGA
jgi:Sec-independent protein translocase protein TatA